MTAIPVPPVSRLDNGTMVEEENDKNLFALSTIKKSLEKDFETPAAVRNKVSRLSQNFSEIATDCMKVYLRLRPFTEEELKNNEAQRSMELSEDRHILTHTAPENSNMYKVSARGIGEVVRHYTFNKIFDEETQQKEFFDETAYPVVQDFINGEDALIFTYGVTSAGKTYTIQGTKGNEGILPRAVELLFDSVGDKLLEDVKVHIRNAQNLYCLSDEEKQIQQALKAEILQMAGKIAKREKSESMMPQTSVSTLESTQTSDSTSAFIDASIADTSLRPQSFDTTREGSLSDAQQGPFKYAIFISFMEIYNELIYDLLVPLSGNKKENRPVLRLADDKKGVPYVVGMRDIQVNSQEEVMKILEFGWQNLHIASTKLNKESSRSHCIFTITLVQVMDIPEPRCGRVSKISFCDLAGSERSSKTKNAGDRLKEASKINTSLMKLGMCIDALRNNQRHKNDKQRQRVVPFRDSRLTRLFKNFLCGHGRSCMIVNANMCASAFDETAHVMKFSALAQEVQIIAKPAKKSRTTLFDEEFDRMVESGKNSRATIAWEKAPLPEEDEKEEEEGSSGDEEEDESESDEELRDSELDVAYWKNREKKLRELIERLRKALIEEAKRSRNIEMTVRNEVSQEFENHIVEVEKRHTARMEETIEILGEEQEKRIEIMARLSDISLKELKEQLQKKKEELEQKQWELVAKNATAEKQAQKMKELLESKVSELQVLVEEKIKAVTENGELKMDIQKKDEELTTLRRQLQRHRRSSSLLYQDEFIDDLQKQNEEGRSIIKYQMEELEDVRKKVELIEEELEKAREALVGAKKENDELRSGSTAPINSQSENRMVESLENAQCEIKQLNEKLLHEKESAQKMVDEYKAELERLQKRLDDQKKAHDKLNAECESLGNSLSSSEDKCSILKDEASTLKQKHLDLEKRLESMNEESESLRELMKQKDKTATTHTAEKSDMEKSNHDLQLKNDELKASLAAAESSLEKLKYKITDVTDRLNKSEEAVLKLNNDLNLKKEETERLQAEKDSLESSRTEAESEMQKSKEKVKELSKEISRQEEEILKLNVGLEEERDGGHKKKLRLTEVEDQLEKADKELSGLRCELEDSKKNLQVLEEKNKEVELECANLKKDLNIERQAHEMDKKLLEEKIKVAAETNQKLAASQSQLEKLKKEALEAKKFEAQLMKEADRLHSEVENLKKENLNMKQNSQKRNSDFSDLTQDVNVLTLERKDLLVRIESLQKELVEVKKAKEQALQENVTNTTTVHDNTELENLRAAMVEMDNTQIQQESLIGQYELEKSKLLEDQKELEGTVEQLRKDMDAVTEEKEKAFSRAVEAEKNLQKEFDESRARQQKEKSSLSEEIKQLKAEVKSIEKAKESEIKNFRDKRDRIVAALQEQINNQKSTNEMLKENLDETAATNVKLQSQNAQFQAENKKLKWKLDEMNQEQLRKSIRACVVLTPKLVTVKNEPLSPEPEVRNEPSQLSESDADRPPVASRPQGSAEKQDKKTGRESATSGRGRRTKSNASTGGQTRRRTKRTVVRPATPHAERQSEDEKESAPSPKKKTRATRSRNKTNSGPAVKVETSDEKAVLDDSELMRETGNSQMFPQSTMELDVTPQLSKKTARTRRKNAKNREEQEHSSEAEEGAARTKSTRRKARANANNNNTSNPSEDDDSSSTAKNRIKVGGMIKNSPVGQAFKRLEAAITPTSKSPVKAKNKTEDPQNRQSKRRKKKLQAEDISLPLEATPSPEEARHIRSAASNAIGATPAHMIRRLRNRK